MDVVMNFIDEILYFESVKSTNSYIRKIGGVPILFTAPHTMEQHFADGRMKYGEPFTKAIAMYMNKYFNTSYLIKVNDTGVDSNRDNHDEFKDELLRIVKENDIKLVIDLHGADKNRDFDVEFGTLNDLSADISTIKELEKAFVNKGIVNLSYNDPFKGGAITQYLFNVKDLDVIQLEINWRFRNVENIENLELLCKALEEFITQYVECISREID